MNWSRRGLVILGGIVGVLMSLLAVVWAEHVPALAWMQRYTSAKNIPCCSERDCVPTPVAVIQFGEQETAVVIHGTIVVLPAKSVHQSEDGETYWCWRDDGQLPPTAINTRCAFFAVGS